MRLLPAVAISFVAVVTGCGGGSNFDFTFIAERAFSSNASKLSAEWKRADAAAAKGPEGSLPKFFADGVSKDILPGGGAIPVISADGRLMAVNRTDAMQVVSTVDGATVRSAPHMNDDRPVAINSDGSRVATVGTVSAKQHVFLITMASGARSDCGELGSTQTNANSEFVGEFVYTLGGDQNLLRFGADCSKTVIETTLVPFLIKSEPLGKRLWGIGRKADNSGNVAFHIDDGGAAVVELDIARFPAQMSVGAGGRLLFIEGSVKLTGPVGTNPQDISYPGASGISHLTLSPDASHYMQIGNGTLGVTLSYAPCDKNADAKSGASVLTDGVIPSLIAVRY